MVKNIKLIAVVFLVIVSFFILLKGLNKTNNYSPNLSSSKIDFNFKAKFLYSDEESTLNELINDKDFSIINIWASWCLPCSCLLYTSPSPRDTLLSRMPSSA